MNKLPSKDEAVNVGFRKATVEGYNHRRVCRDPDHDIYYSGWMDCYDWLLTQECKHDFFIASKTFNNPSEKHITSVLLECARCGERVNGKDRADNTQP